jgi:hypothetical protein
MQLCLAECTAQPGIDRAPQTRAPRHVAGSLLLEGNHETGANFIVCHRTTESTQRLAVANFKVSTILLLPTAQCRAVLTSLLGEDPAL